MSIIVWYNKYDKGDVKMFKPNYNNILDCALNRQPARVPLYEHNISVGIMEKLTGKKFGHLANGTDSDFDEFMRNYCEFFKFMGYDTVTYEACVVDILPNGGALAHPQPGYIDSREKFEAYPFDKIKDIYINAYKKYFDGLRKFMPEGMKAIGGIGNGIFEIVQDLVGYECLAIMSFDDPELFLDLFTKVGDMLLDIWAWFLEEYSDVYCVCRFGDDLGYRDSTLLSPDTIKENVLPQYKKIVDKVHSYNKPFLLHSCGCIFAVMEDLIQDVKIDAKHSNEDQISDFGVWVDKYGDRIGNFGGIDTDNLVRMDDDELKDKVISTLEKYAKGHGGFAIGSGNSIPDYVNAEKYRLMVDTVRKWRGDF